MSSILDDIIDSKKKEVESAKVLQTISIFEQQPLFGRQGISLKNRILRGTGNGIIAEFKRKSPSKGWFVDPGIMPDKIIEHYNNMDVAGISVLTDRDFFGGSRQDLERARQLTALPLLRKDFIIDEWQIYEAKAMGADVILVIAACNDKYVIDHFIDVAHSIGLEVLLELHDEDELDKVNENADLIGINSRNLKTFKVDIAKTTSLLAKLPPGIPVVAESGMNSGGQIKEMLSLGFSAVLAGEMFMREFADKKDNS